jgi:phage terminase small subunit
VSILKNTKHEQFAHGVAKGLSATQAYLDAGFAENGARANAARLIAKDNVSARIEEIKANIEKVAEAKVGVSKAWVLEKLQQNLERALQEIAVLDREGNPTGEYKYEGNVANKALELIGKELGMFKDRIVPENPDGSPILSGVKVFEVGKP